MQCVPAAGIPAGTGRQNVIQPALRVTHAHDFVDTIKIGRKQFRQIGCDAHAELLTDFHQGDLGRVATRPEVARPGH